MRHIDSLRKAVGEVRLGTPAPDYLLGHCLYRSEGVAACHSAAVVHVLLKAQGTGDATPCTFVCATHAIPIILNRAYQEMHSVAHPCVSPQALWVTGNPSHCIDDENDKQREQHADEQRTEELAGVA